MTSAWDLLLEVGAAEGIDVGRIVRVAEERRAAREQWEREHPAEVHAAQVAAVEREFIYASDGTVLPPDHDRGDPCSVCDARRLALESM